ncbi:Colicin I receptor [termite gut metagenome]|uniref:Colicin I receptor n=1 Tax=termite gut metagenome TaxID=433724 RepID=A0A5J4QJB6_9ZZZZ
MWDCENISTVIFIPHTKAKHMKTYIFLFVAMISCNIIYSQNIFRAIIKDADTKEVLIGATAMIDATHNGTATDANGIIIIKNIPGGIHKIVFSHIGYENQVHEFSFPFENDTPVEVLLENRTSELEEIVVSSTRSTRTILNIPTRLEFISGEELEEKGNMKPGDIRMLLSESTGIQTQQTSPITANASIRIQGLDGRYTQILKDGFPIYSGAASGLGLLQIPPLDLKQVEIIKGSSSTLFGGGAIAGLVNLISKTPGDERELSFHLSGTSASGLDLNGFYAQGFNKIGVTLFASRNSNKAYNPADTDLSAIPRFERYVANPRLFVYFNEKTKLDFGVNTAFENRLGGDMYYIKGERNNEHSYFEDNQTQRISTQFSLEHKLNDRSNLAFRNSYNYFHRITSIPGYIFDGRQNGTFSEINYVHIGEISEWIAGGNLWTDSFTEMKPTGIPTRNYRQLTGGLFAQNTSQVTGWFSVESGLRGDYVVDYGFTFLPRLSVLFKINNKLTSRIGGGFGYKTPTIFTEESERIHYRNVLPVSSDRNKLEHSYGANADINYRTAIKDDVFLSFNQLFFYTYLKSPLILTPLSDGIYQFHNINGYLDTKGAETNIKISYKDFMLFVGYTFIHARVGENGICYQNPLTSKHRLNNILMYEVDDSWKIGLEAYYYSPQKLNDGTTGKAYWICGAMVEKIWEHFSVYANFENYTDTRQTKFGSIYTGTLTNPVFKDIYAPLDGFVASLGLKIRL